MIYIFSNKTGHARRGPVTVRIAEWQNSTRFASNDLTSFAELDSFCFQGLEEFLVRGGSQGEQSTVHVPKLCPVVVGVTVCPANSCKG